MSLEEKKKVERLERLSRRRKLLHKRRSGTRISIDGIKLVKRGWKGAS